MADGLDLYSPPEIAGKVEHLGVTKANLAFGQLAALAAMAGAFIALGGIFYFVVVSDVKGGYGVQQLLGGVVFTLGLLLCSVAGAELFTGNNLLSIALASGKISWKGLLRNWATVWFFNGVGAVLIALIAFYAEHWAGGGNLVGAKALYTGASKAALPPLTIFFKAILCNVLVCLASWLGYAGRTVTDKLFGMVLPVAAFVAAGFEHSVANMFFIPYAMLLKGNPKLVELSGLAPTTLHYLSASGLLKNLTFATLGNIVGGAVMVGLMYWAIYLRHDGAPVSHQEKKAV
jgi:formate/nitrite transporter